MQAKRIAPLFRPAAALAGVLTATLWLAGGCASPALTLRAEGVRVLAPDADRGCQKLGRARVRVTSKVLFFSRSIAAVSSELATLARNAAAEMEGNAVAAEGPVQDGSQRFVLYRCPDAAQ